MKRSMLLALVATILLLVWFNDVFVGYYVFVKECERSGGVKFNGVIDVNAVSYTDLWSFDEINAVKCTERLLPLQRGRLGGGRFSLLTSAFDVQEIMLTLA
ncbi:MAG: hypothetical protein KAY06_01640 [Aeromonadaceae bacterium]|nr:hypothetical protein [Aeromonadaceae bacterium]